MDFEITGSASAWVADHKKRILANASSAVMIAIICGVMGCFDFFSMRFDPSRLMEMSYWYHVFARTVCLVCAFNLGINVFQPYMEDKNQNLRRDAARYDMLVDMKEQRSFENHILNVLNPAEKRKAWIAKIDKRINSLGKWARMDSKALWGMPNEKMEANPQLAEAKKSNRYCRKRETLEAMKSDEWMAANLDSIKVRGYKPIDPSVFDLSINGSEKYSGYKLTSKTGMARGTKTASSVAFMAMASAMVSSWYLDFDGGALAEDVAGWLGQTINALLDIAFVLWQFWRGMAYTPKLVEDEVHRPYVDRIRILTDYFTSSDSPINDFAAKKAEIDQRAAKAIEAKPKEKPKDDDILGRGW